ncbi:hypothetical protein QYE76_019623 [Lolium multiflorum]|uniref:Uncharacterized protein n=1 Tax=Lolium multiflorum TaxID=4521 RepID=A0AAD8VQK6_LOLMU|nr:hypothetical protein QYE76_019623 [Lolium multiflorum]
MLPAAVLQLLVVLRWSEPDASGSTTASSSPIKAFFESLDLGKIAVDPLLSNHRGGGDWEWIFDDSALGRSAGSALDWLRRPRPSFSYCNDLSCNWIHGDLLNPIQFASWVARLLLWLLHVSPELLLAPSFNLRREALFTLPFDGKDAAGDGGKSIAGEFVGDKVAYALAQGLKVVTACVERVYELVTPGNPAERKKPLSSRDCVVPRGRRGRAAAAPRLATPSSFSPSPSSACVAGQGPDGAGAGGPSLFPSRSAPARGRCGRVVLLGRRRSGVAA